MKVITNNVRGKGSVRVALMLAIMIAAIVPAAAQSSYTGPDYTSAITALGTSVSDFLAHHAAGLFVMLGSVLLFTAIWKLGKRAVKSL